jgi:hypothetical protein
VAALFVQKDGVYFNRPDVDPWDEERDAMKYAGPLPVVAHPPCARWCMLAGLVEARYGHKVGDDGGAFAFALDAVRQWCGVLEHPAWTKAWYAHDLTPPNRGGWCRTLDGGWVAHIEQGLYGHDARKATWLYAYGVDFLPSLDWGDAEPTAMVSWADKDCRPELQRISKAQASKTPAAFAELLIRIAKSATL